MGETGQARRLSDAARGRAPGRLVARSALKAFWTDESGATAVEIGVLLALITVVLIAALTSIGKNIGVAFTKTADAVGS